MSSFKLVSILGKNNQNDSTGNVSHFKTATELLEYDSQKCKQVAIERENLGEKLKSISEVIQNLTEVNTLYIKGCRFDGSQSSPMPSSPKKVTRMASTLKNSFRGAGTILKGSQKLIPLANALKGQKTLTTLFLSDNGISGKDIKPVCTRLKENYTLSRLM